MVDPRFLMDRSLRQWSSSSTRTSVSNEGMRVASAAGAFRRFNDTWHVAKVSSGSFGHLSDPVVIVGVAHTGPVIADQLLITV